MSQPVEMAQLLCEARSRSDIAEFKVYVYIFISLVTILTDFIEIRASDEINLS